MGQSFPSFFLMKKNGDTYGDFDSVIYPLHSSSSNHFHSATFLAAVKGYTLQLSAAGASFFSLIAWSHGLCWGSLWDATLTDTLVELLIVGQDFHPLHILPSLLS